MIETRELPSAVDAERLLLGTIILEPKMWGEIASELAGEELYLDSHRKVFAAMAELAEDQQPIDTLGIGETLERRRELQAVGGMAYLSDLTTGVGQRTSVAHLIDTVRQKAMLRSLIHAANGIMAQALEATEKPHDILGAAQDALLQLALSAGTRDKDIFVDAADFCAGPDEQPDWLVEGLIERGSNGIVAADPKGAKSLTVAGNLSVCLAMGIPWMGLTVKRRTKVAVVSREDNPATTKRRIKQIVKGKGGRIEELRGFLHVNSKAQSASLMLDNPREVNNLIRCLKKWGSEFVIFDVFNKLHNQDENDNTKVRAVMNQLDKIQAETKAQMCVLHHWNKGDASQSLTRRVRGAGAIAGFAEWIAGIEMVDEEHQVRKIAFETKVGEYLAPIHYQIEDNSDKSAVNFKLTAPMETEKKRKREG